MKGTSHEDQYTFFMKSHPVLLRTRNVSDKSCRENQNTVYPFKDEAQTALFKDPVRTAL